MWEVLIDNLPIIWLAFLGAVGAFIIESYLLITKPYLLHKTKIRYKAKMLLGIFTGFVLAYVLQPVELAQAFLIGVGWEVVLSSVIKEANTILASDPYVLRKYETNQLPKINDTLQGAKEKMQNIGTKDRIPVVDDNGRLLGLVTDGMIERQAKKKIPLARVKIKDVMIGASDVIKVDEYDSVAKALKISTQAINDQVITVGGLPVIDREGIVKGLLSFEQLKALDRSLFGSIG